MKLWQRGENYIGTDWSDYFVLLGQHRDSDRVTRSNFRVALAEIRKIAKPFEATNNTEESYIQVIRSGHWAVGWVECIGIHKDAPKELIGAGDAILEKIADYPLLDESDHSELEWQEITEYWDSLPIKWRLRDYIQPAGLPCFAARHSVGEIMHQYEADRLWDSLASE